MTLQIIDHESDCFVHSFSFYIKHNSETCECAHTHTLQSFSQSVNESVSSDTNHPMVSVTHRTRAHVEEKQHEDYIEEKKIEGKNRSKQFTGKIEPMDCFFSFVSSCSFTCARACTDDNLFVCSAFGRACFIFNV